MGINIRERNGVEYLYILAGNSQYFLGRRDNLDELNMQNLYKAVKIVDRNFERTFSKYLGDIHEHAKYMPEKEHTQYLAKRLEKIADMAEQAGANE